MSGRHPKDEDEGIGPDVPDEPVPEPPPEDDPRAEHHPTEKENQP